MGTKAFLTCLACIAIIAVWQLVVNGSKDVQTTGLFMEKPRPGYVWENDGMSQERSFFANTTTKWRMGMKHPEHNVVAGYLPESWVAMPGYKITDYNSLSTDWVPGLQHATLKAISTEREGYWLPNTGYRFSTDFNGQVTTVWNPGETNPNGKMYASNTEGVWTPFLGYEWQKANLWLGSNANRLVWVPGLYFTDKKLISDRLEKHYIPFPGYQFVDSTKNWDVVWSPGTVNPANSNLVADFAEGTWRDITLVNSEPIQQTTILDDLLASLGYAIGAKIAEKVAGGDNPVTDELNKRSLTKGVEGAIKVFQ